MVVDHLEFLIGSISTKGFKYPAYNLTAKMDGKTRTRHIPKDLLPVVKRMTARYRRFKSLLNLLDEVNWQLALLRGRLEINHLAPTNNYAEQTLRHPVIF